MISSLNLKSYLSFYYLQSYKIKEEIVHDKGGHDS